MSNEATSVLASPDAAPVGDAPAAPAPTGDAGAPNIPDFLKGLEPEFVNDPIMKDVKDVPTLVKNYVNTKRKIGQKGHVLPTQNSSEDEWNSLFKAIGLPESTEAYKYDAEIDLDQDFIKGFNEAAHKAGVLPSQAKKLMGYYKQVVDKADQEIAQEQQQTVAQSFNSLKSEWGEAFPKKLGVAQGVLRTFADDATVKQILEGPLGNDTTFIKLLNKIGENMKEDTFQGQVVQDFHMSPSEAKRAVDEIMTDKNHPYWKPDHEGHKKAVMEVQKLFKISSRS